MGDDIDAEENTEELENTEKSITESENTEKIKKIGKHF